jgi:hypothetical protein
MSVATRPWWNVLLAAALLLLLLALLPALLSAAGLLLELPSLLGVLLAAGMAAEMLALRDSVPPACAAWLTHSSWNGFCSGRLLHLKQRSKLSNLQDSMVQGIGRTQGHHARCSTWVSRRCKLSEQNRAARKYTRLWHSLAETAFAPLHSNRKYAKAKSIV